MTLESAAPAMVNMKAVVDGIAYRQDTLSLHGDVRQNVKPGKKRTFTWDIRKDFPKWPDIEVTVESVAQSVK